jgi:hypothetical protein
MLPTVSSGIKFCWEGPFMGAVSRTLRMDEFIDDFNSTFIKFFGHYELLSCETVVWNKMDILLKSFVC